MKPYLLRLHRWTSLVFALPLLLVIITGLILSFEPIVQIAAVKPGSVDPAAVTAILAKADAEGKAVGLSIAPQEGRITIGGGPGSPGRSFALATGEAIEPGAVSRLFQVSRGVHERLIGDLGWLVIASTIAMLVIVLLGVLMGLPRLRNTVSGWHKGTAWILLPLIVLSPLSGLAIAFGITLAPAPARPAGAPVPLAEAVRMVAAQHDLAAVTSIRRRGPVSMARVWNGQRLETYSVTPQGLVPLAANWPRLIHEGNGFGVWTGLANVVTSVALLGLLGTGLVIWSRRTFRPRQPRPAVRTA